MKADHAIHTAYEEFKAADAALAEKNLMRAVLNLAMEDMKKGGAKAKDARRFFVNDDPSYLYSFISICNHLDLCQRTVRTIVGLIPVNTSAAKKTVDEDRVAA